MVGDRLSRSPAGSRPRVPVIAVVAPVSSKRTGRRGPVPATCLRKTRRCGLTFAGQGEFRRLRILQTQLLQTLPRSMSIITVVRNSTHERLTSGVERPSESHSFPLARRSDDTEASIGPRASSIRPTRKQFALIQWRNGSVDCIHQGFTRRTRANLTTQGRRRPSYRARGTSHASCPCVVPRRLMGRFPGVPNRRGTIQAIEAERGIARHELRPLEMHLGP